MHGPRKGNKATVILAAVATAFCVSPALFLKYGESLRERSAFARFSREAEKKMSVSKGRQGSKDSGVSDEGTLVDEGDVEALAERLAEI